MSGTAFDGKIHPTRRPFQKPRPPPLSRSVTVPFISSAQPFSLTNPQCIATVLSDLHLLSDAVSRAGSAVEQAGMIADSMHHLAAFLTDSYQHLSAYWQDTSTNSENAGGLQDIVLKILLEQMTVTARTLEEQCRQIGDHAAQLQRQTEILDDKQLDIDRVVEKATSSIRLEKKALDLAADELEKKCQLATDHLASPKLSVVPGRDENSALLEAQREQLRLQKLVSRYQLEMKSLREQHGIVKSEMLATQRDKQHANHEVEISKKRAHKDIQGLKFQCAAVQDEARKAHALATTERRQRHHLSVALAKQQEEISRMKDAVKAEKTLRMQLRVGEQQLAELTERYQKLKKDQEFNRQYIVQLELAIKERAASWVKQKRHQKTTEEIKRWNSILQQQEALKQNSQSHLHRKLGHRTTEKWQKPPALPHYGGSRSKSVHLPVLEEDVPRSKKVEVPRETLVFPKRVRTRLQRLN